jgi:hypothetical protein
MNAFYRRITAAICTMLPGMSICGALSASLCKASLIYGTAYTGGVTGNVYSINSATGVATLIAQTETGYPGFGMAELDGNLYVADFEPTAPPGGSTFGTLNPNTGAFSPIGNVADQGWRSLAPDDADNVMLTVDTAAGPILTAVRPNGSTKVIGGISSAGPSSMISLAYDNTDHILYGLNYARQLYQISATNAQATLIGATGLTDYSYTAGLCFDQATSTLFLNDENAQTGDSSLYTVNTNTGLANLVGPNSRSSGLSIQTIAVVPEPNLSILAAAMLAIPKLRRRTTGQ